MYHREGTEKKMTVSDLNVYMHTLFFFPVDYVQQSFSILCILALRNVVDIGHIMCVSMYVHSFFFVCLF